VQQYEGRTPVGLAGEVRFVVDEKLEAEAYRAGLQAARGERVTRRSDRSSTLSGKRCTFIQPLIINVGEEAFYEEFRKSNGWIVAKDVHVAFYYGGSDQKVLEMTDDPGTVTLVQKSGTALRPHIADGGVLGQHDFQVFL
jgi:hypothetical protein